MPLAISNFFAQLGYPLRTVRQSWGSERDGVIVLRSWEDERTGPPDAVRVLRNLSTYRESQAFGLNERVTQLAQLWAGTARGFVVMAVAVDPDGPKRKIKSYYDDVVFPIETLVEGGANDVFARLGQPIPVAQFPTYARRHRTSKAKGRFPATANAAGNEQSLEQRLERFARVQIRTQQAAFREAVFRASNGRCVVSGCSVPEALEAAHLRGRRWKDGHNDASDGVLLRRDLHALYDRELLSFLEGGGVTLDPRVHDEYAEFVTGD
jgi:hypothetical protein